MVQTTVIFFYTFFIALALGHNPNHGTGVVKSHEPHGQEAAL